MQDNVLEIIKRRLENEEEMSFASFEEYAELYGYNETEDFFSFGLKRAIEIISVYIKLEKDENWRRNTKKWQKKAKKLILYVKFKIRDFKGVKNDSWRIKRSIKSIWW